MANDGRWPTHGLSNGYSIRINYMVKLVNVGSWEENYIWSHDFVELFCSCRLRSETISVCGSHQRGGYQRHAEITLCWSPSLRPSLVRGSTYLLFHLRTSILLPLLAEHGCLLQKIVLDLLPRIWRARVLNTGDPTNE